MPLPIFLLSILAFASAMPNFSLDLPDILRKNQIPRIDELDDPQIWEATKDFASLTTLELVSKFGYNGELHEVLTSGGYILELHRITGRANSTSKVQKPVALVIHGLLCSSACWVLSGPEKGLAFILADAGYDVWLGNTRGNVYGRKHLLSNIDKRVFWNFSWHEIGLYDLPAMIDHIVKTTGCEKLFYLGHSQGTTAFFVMASTRPEYQDKIQAMFAMAPVAYCGRMENVILQFLATFTNTLNKLLEFVDIYEFAPTGKFMKKFQRILCHEDAITQPLCSNILFLIGGFNKDQFNATLLPLILEHTPAGASTKQIMHYGQLIKTGLPVLSAGKFRQYDYWWIGNMLKYKKFHPPEYDLGKIKVPVLLHYGTNDLLANVNDVHQLSKDLGNTYGEFPVPHKDFNHLDFMWAKDVKVLLYDKILSLMTHF